MPDKVTVEIEEVELVNVNVDLLQDVVAVAFGDHVGVGGEHIDRASRCARGHG